MGRAKLPIKYREEGRARRSTYMTRWKGVKKKAEEINLLCGIQVLVASHSPEFNTTECWPEKDTPEFQQIRERYLCLHKKRYNSHGNDDEGSSKGVEQIPRLPMSSSSFSTTQFHEEMVAMEIKLKEIRERRHFLRADSQDENLARQFPGEEEPLLAQFAVSTPSLQDPPSDQSSQFANLLPADFAHFNMFLQQDDLLTMNMDQTSSSAPTLPPHDQPIPPFAGFNMCFQQDTHPPLIQQTLFAQSISPTEQYDPATQCILPDHAGFNMPLPHDSLHSLEQPFTFDEHFPCLEQPAPFDESLHHLVDLNNEDPSNRMLPSDSPFWSSSDDLNWANSLFLDFESAL